MFKSLSLAIVSLAMITACAHPLTTVVEEQAANRQQTLLYSTSISAGACDDLGRFVRDTQQPITLRQEASALPVHE